MTTLAVIGAFLTGIALGAVGLVVYVAWSFMKIWK